MTGYDGMRASDRDREATVRVLRDAHVAGRLDLGEVRSRAGAAYCARTWGELRALTVDLPGSGIAALQVTEELEVWAAEEVKVRPAPGTYHGPERRVAPLLLITVACLCLAAAGWRPAAIIPLIILALSALAAAGRSARQG
jgi:hypothetical protein